MSIIWTSSCAQKKVGALIMARASSYWFILYLFATFSDKIKIVKKWARSQTTNLGKTSLFVRTISRLDMDNMDLDQRYGIFIDISCSVNQQLLISTADEHWFTNTFLWLVWDAEGFLLDSNFTLPISTFSYLYVASSFSIRRFRKQRAILPLTIDSVGSWNNNTQMLSFLEYEPRINFQRTIVKGGILFVAKIYDLDKLSEQLQDDTYMPEMDVSNRFMFSSALHMAYLYNYSLEFVITNTWGDRHENGSWSGIMGLLQRNEVDISLSSMLPLSIRLEVSFPGVPFHRYWMAIVFKQPRALGTYRAMILELTPSAWLGVGGIIVAGAIVFAITQKYQRVYDDLEEGRDNVIAIGFVQSVGILSNQGLTMMPNGTPSRIACLFLLVVGFLVSNYYSAETMTALLSESPPLIKSLDQLIGTGMQFVAMDAPYMTMGRHRVFKNNVINRLDKGYDICPLNQCVQSIMTNDTIFLGEFFVLFQAINEQVQSEAICDLTVFQAGSYSNALNLFRLCRHFRELFVRGLLRILEHGLVKKERKRWVVEKLMCSRVTEFIIVQLEAVSVAFGIFLSGSVLSMAVLMMEIAQWKRSQNRSKNENKALEEAKQFTFKVEVL